MTASSGVSMTCEQKKDSKYSSLEGLEAEDKSADIFWPPQVLMLCLQLSTQSGQHKVSHQCWYSFPFFFFLFHQNKVKGEQVSFMPFSHDVPEQMPGTLGGCIQYFVHLQHFPWHRLLPCCFCWYCLLWYSSYYLEKPTVSLRQSCLEYLIYGIYQRGHAGHNL